MGSGLGRHAQTAHQGGNHVVGVALDVDRQFEQLLFAERFTHQGIGPHQAGHDRRGAAAQASGRRHGQTHPGLQTHRLLARLLPHPLGRAVHKVVRSPPQVGALAALDDQVEAMAPPLHAAQLEHVVEVEGRPEAVKPRPDVGRGGRHMNHNTLANLGPHHLPSPVAASVSACGCGG